MLTYALSMISRLQRKSSPSIDPINRASLRKRNAERREAHKAMKLKG